MTAATAPDSRLWQLVFSAPQIDAEALAQAVYDQLRAQDLDYRSRLLIRRSAEVLQTLWPAERYGLWLAEALQGERFQLILAESFDEVGFGLLKSRVVMSTRREIVRELLSELGSLLHSPTRLVIGGSIAAILTGKLTRQTEDIDVPDEVPQPIRDLGDRVDAIAARYGLRLAHFQSHFLPSDWNTRLRWFDRFAQLASG